MAKVVSDIFIGNFGISQGFGENPDRYKQFGLQGHDGVDFLCPSGTVLLAPVNGKVVKKAFDAAGYGWYVEIWDPSQNLMTIQAHCSSITVEEGQTVAVGQQVAISDNTGYSTGPHLHFGVGDTDGAGKRQNTGNGYAGWYNSLDSNRISWDIRNPSSAAAPAPVGGTPAPTTTVRKIGTPQQEIGGVKIYQADGLDGVYVYTDKGVIRLTTDVPNLGAFGWSNSSFFKVKQQGNFEFALWDDENFQGHQHTFGGQGWGRDTSADRDFGANVSSMKIRTFEPEPAPPAAPTPPPVPTMVSFFISSNPTGAKIYINDVYQSDLTPANKEYSLVPGNYTFRLVKSGFEDFVETVDMKAGDLYNKIVDLLPLEVVAPGPTPPAEMQPPVGTVPPVGVSGPYTGWSAPKAPTHKDIYNRVTEIVNAVLKKLGL